MTLPGPKISERPGPKIEQRVTAARSPVSSLTAHMQGMSMSGSQESHPHDHIQLRGLPPHLAVANGSRSTINPVAAIQRPAYDSRAMPPRPPPPSFGPSIRDRHKGPPHSSQPHRNGGRQSYQVAYARSDHQFQLSAALEVVPLHPYSNGRQGLPARPPTLDPMTAATPVGLLLATGLPLNVNSRLFRKKIGYAVHAAFPRNPPRFNTHLKSNKGAVEHGLVMFPNDKCCDIFLHRYGHGIRGGGTVEIAKHRLRFSKANPQEHRITRQQALSLNYEPRAAVNDAMSDYEDEEEDVPEVFVHFAEIGMWDDRGRFAPAWQSKELKDHYSALTLDGDHGNVTVRIQDQLIRLSLYRLERIVVHAKDVYFESTVLPTYLADESDGYEALRQHVGIMPTSMSMDSVKYVRLSALDDEHSRCAPFSYVVKVRCHVEDALSAFILRWQRKIIDLVDYQEIERNPEMPFRGSVLKKLEHFYDTISFQLAFQVQSVLLAGLLLPLEVLQLRRTIEMIDEALPASQAASLFKSVRAELHHRGPAEVSPFGHRDFARRLQELLGQTVKGTLVDTHEVGTDSNNFMIHAATLTPAGLWLEGPFVSQGNRVIRQYPGKEEYFLRVRIAEESDQLMRDSREIDQDTEIFSVRMRNFLVRGLTIGGRHFKFLAFSTSSLREHTVWFVADFKDPRNGDVVSAQNIRDGIGDLREIRIAAKYAARMGQAFTTTPFAIDVPVKQISRVPDKKSAYGPEFTDGCGYISSNIVQRLHEKDPRRRRKRKKAVLPTVFQVRIGGAKGVLALNTAAVGMDVALRTSMIKFQLHPDENQTLTLEVASSADNPLAANLNRPLVALLETLGVPPRNFIKIQDKAVSTLREAVTSTSAALKLYQSGGFGTGPEVSSLLQTLHRTLNLQGITQVPFLKECNLTCLTSALRQIKYKARSSIDQAVTLMGVIDESGWLQEGQIFAQIRQGKEDGSVEERFMEGRCVIGRSPFLAPGDVQYATLVGRAPHGSPLNDLYNCVVFSQHGRRPLPNQLAGGDLDGDLYNIIQNPLLFPERTAKAGSYTAPKPTQLSRPCTIEDVIDFFLVFLQSDRLGMIADRHLILSDRSPRGVEDADCIKLAEMASIAVDYMKSGVAPDFRKIPRVPDNAKPDYCQSEHRVEIHGDAARPLATVESRNRWNREPHTFYKSEKALGQLFRRIDVASDIDQWGKRVAAPLTESALRRTLWSTLMKWLPDKWCPDDLEHELAQIESFYARMSSFAESYAPEKRRYPLSECEVFMGVILSRFGTKFGASSRGYNAQIGLKDDFMELIDIALSAHCGRCSVDDASSLWNEAIVNPKTLREAMAAVDPAGALSDSDEDEASATSSKRRGSPHDGNRNRVFKQYQDSVVRSRSTGPMPTALIGLHDDAQALLIQLCRWIRAAERYQDSRASPAHRRRGQQKAFESAKWIAIGPALLKFEELELWETFCLEQGVLTLASQ
ncbi:unnamed protein product [Parajaminaea phylloscopi]